MMNLPMTLVSDLEELLLFQCRAVDLPDPEREYRFAPPRMYRADFAWLENDPPLLVEVEGGIWMRKGGHNTGRGILRDIEKGNLAAMNGFLYLRFAAKHIHSGEAVWQIESVLKPSQEE